MTKTVRTKKRLAKNKKNRSKSIKKLVNEDDSHNSSTLQNKNTNVQSSASLKDQFKSRLNDFKGIVKYVLSGFTFIVHTRKVISIKLAPLVKLKLHLVYFLIIIFEYSPRKFQHQIKAGKATIKEEH